MNALPLPEVSRRLRCNYRKLYNLVVSGEVPARRDASGARWVVDEKDMDEIAAAVAK